MKASVTTRVAAMLAVLDSGSRRAARHAERKAILQVRKTSN